jgi:hypothetical protein
LVNNTTEITEHLIINILAAPSNNNNYNDLTKFYAGQEMATFNVFFCRFEEEHGKTESGRI